MTLINRNFIISEPKFEILQGRPNLLCDYGKMVNFGYIFSKTITYIKMILSQFVHLLQYHLLKSNEKVPLKG